MVGYTKRRFVSVAFVYGTLLLAGCTAPPNDVPAGADEDPAPVRLGDGWDVAVDGQHYWYQDGTFHATVVGDQILVELEISEETTLDGIDWEISGRLDTSDDQRRTYTQHFSLTKAGDDWPRVASVRSFTGEYGSVSVQALGVNQAIDDPQFLIFPSDGLYEYRMADSHDRQVVLEPGVWQIWLGVVHSADMDLSITLPPQSLVDVPRAGHGCSVVTGSEFETEAAARLAPVGGVISDAAYRVNVPEDRLLKLTYLPPAGAVKSSEIQLLFPDTTRWAAQYTTGAAQQTTPSEWPGVHTVSALTGTYDVRWTQSAEAGQGGFGPFLTYCMI